MLLLSVLFTLSSHSHVLGRPEFQNCFVDSGGKGGYYHPILTLFAANHFLSGIFSLKILLQFFYRAAASAGARFGLASTLLS